MNASLAWSKLPLGIAYFVAAALAVSLTRFGGGVAFLWVACALLIADLLREPRSRWIYSIVPCAVAGMAATALFGFGWKAAPFLMVVNVIEAVTAAWLFRRSGRRDRLLGSVPSLGVFVLAAGIVAPLIAGLMAGAVLWGMGRPVLSGMVDFFTGHALGNITFTPLAMMIGRGRLRRRIAGTPRRKLAETVALLAILIGVTVGVFSTQHLPVLFLPILPLIIIAFRAGVAGTIIGLGLIALIGGAATLTGSGPATLASDSLGNQLQFFQLYLAVTVLTALPVVADLQNRTRLHRLVQSSEAGFRLIADHSSDVLTHIEVDGRVRYISPSIEGLSGHRAETVVGRSSLLFVAPEHRERVIAAHAAVLAARGDARSHEFLGLCADGSMRWFESQSRAICDADGRVESVLSIARDISARKQKELRLVSEALTDPLTGLPNRRAFKAEIDRRMAEWHEDVQVCLAVFDIDRFKSVNDVHGHDAGDAVLKTFAEVVQRVVRDSDAVARLGGEEFAVMFPATAVPEALTVCDRVRSEMARAVTRVGDEEIRVTVSGGVALLGRLGPDAALKQADRALYTAKRGGRDQMALAA